MVRTLLGKAEGSEDVVRIKEETGKHASRKIGLGNVQDRIRMYYGPEYGIHFVSDRHETVFTLRLPLKERGVDNGTHFDS